MNNIISLHPYLWLFWGVFLQACTNPQNTAKSEQSALLTTTVAFADTTQGVGKLMAGNWRFRNDRSIHPHQSSHRRLETAKEQKPFAAIVTCSDSRVSPVVLFDAGIGDLFIIRTAGNIVWELELASIEYAVEHLGVSVVMVMGHDNCGAVNAYVEGRKGRGHIQRIITALSEEEEEQAAIQAPEAFQMDACVNANVVHQIRYILNNSEIISEKIQRNELALVGADYIHQTGEVRLLDYCGPNTPQVNTQINQPTHKNH